MTQSDSFQKTVLICQGTGCISSKSDEIFEEFEEQLKNVNLIDKINVNFTGCHGFCAQGPIVIIEPDGIMYCKIQTPTVKNIVISHLKEGKSVEEIIYIVGLSPQHTRNQFHKLKD